jgi:renalase
MERCPHLEDDADSVSVALLAAFAALGAPPPDAVTAHRWRYAKADQAPLDRAVWLPAVQVGLCGDWLGGGRVEDAWLSGRALAWRDRHAAPQFARITVCRSPPAVHRRRAA